MFLAMVRVSNFGKFARANLSPTYVKFHVESESAKKIAILAGPSKVMAIFRFFH